LGDGTCVYLIRPTSNTACFQAFLNVLSRKFARQDILLVLDDAPTIAATDLALPHNISLLLLVLDDAPTIAAADLALPHNISLLFLPPYSPELNPKENLSGMKSARNSSRTTPSNPSTPCAPSSSRRSSISKLPRNSVRKPFNAPVFHGSPI
jgi:transposase